METVRVNLCFNGQYKGLHEPCGFCPGNGGQSVVHLRTYCGQGGWGRILQRQAVNASLSLPVPHQ